jgi:hypothetical protein
MPFFSAVSGYVPGAGLTLRTYLFALENRAGSGIDVTLKRGVFQRDPGSVAYLGTMPIVTAYRAIEIEQPEGATFIDKCPFDTAFTSSGDVAVWSAVNNVGLVAPLAATPISAQVDRSFCTRLRDLSGQILSNDLDLIPFGNARIRPGRAFAWAVDVDAAGADPATANWFFQVVWEELPASTYTISGTVRNSGVGVVGAKVNVVVSDDVTMTNGYLLGTYTTTTGGAWSAEIPDGMVAYAYAQNFTGGTYFTAPGAPYIT